jgi:hypothetical protein
MKKFNLLNIFLVFCILMGCSKQEITKDQQFNERRGNIRISPVETTSDPNTEGHCVYTHLIAGQHYVAGSVTVDLVGDNLIITFSTTGDWTLGTTHLSIGNCDEDWVPLNGAGNPQIGQFDYTEPFSYSPQEVVYVIPVAGLDDNYCFAAHAEVQGPSGGETAWAEGAEFSGRSWAMFVESFLSDCPTDGEDGPT